MGVSVINRTIKFFTIFLSAFSVFAGGDDRDKEYYEALDEELAAFEAQLAEDLSNQAALDAFAKKLAKQTALDEFQQKLADEKAAAAASTAAYQSKLANDAMVEELMDALQRELEIDAFEAQLAAELAAQEMMAEILEEEARANRLAEFQAQLEAEKAAAAASTAAYQAKVASEEVIGVIEEVVVTVAAHEECKHTLNLSDSNIELFKTALAAGNLFNVGPQTDNGTEFTANRWDEYANCVSNYVNPF